MFGHVLSEQVRKEFRAVQGVLRREEILDILSCWTFGYDGETHVIFYRVMNLVYLRCIVLRSHRSYLDSLLDFHHTETAAQCIVYFVDTEMVLMDQHSLEKSKH